MVEDVTADALNMGCAAFPGSHICRWRRRSTVPFTAGRWTSGATAARPMRLCCRCACQALGYLLMPCIAHFATF